jgi:hypothetical protein
MDALIIATSGRKQSGKSSLCAFIQAELARRHDELFKREMAQNDIEVVTDASFVQEPDGRVKWTQTGGRGERFSYYQDEPIHQRRVDEHSKVFNFADSLKDVCIKVLGIAPEQCYGTDEQKNSLTKYTWERFPEEVRLTGKRRAISVNYIHQLYCSCRQRPACAECAATDKSIADARQAVSDWNDSLKLRRGNMTGREVMQVFGTDVMRRMFDDDIWVNATVRGIRESSPPVALIGDMRFRTEFHALYKHGAYVIRLERKITNDTHSSETDFDGFDFSQYERCLVIPEGVEIPEKNRLAMDWIDKILQHRSAA